MSQPPQNLILEQLEKILCSKTLRKSDGPRKLLKYVVRKALDGQEVTQEDAAHEVFKIETFDPSIDSNVRTAARNLRIKLKKYYRSEGRSDPINIEIPKGTYVPNFSPALPKTDRASIQDQGLVEKQSRLGIRARLLSFVWSYPFMGKNEASWAVKESWVLKGDLGSAREKPALGVAIVTTELALAAFGQAADSRIEGCISWGAAMAQRKPPYQIRVEVPDPRDDAKQTKTDFRHTLAFAVILARARKHYSYLESYLDLVLKKQKPDGGWPPESATTISPVFTAFYAVELLHLALADPAFSNSLGARIATARTKGLRWLMKNRIPDQLLWSSGALREFAWDGVLGTAWVVHRLTCTADVPLDGWRRCLDDALSAMIESALSPETWAGSTEAQRYRVEARVAAAVSRAKRMKHLSTRSQEQGRLYAGAWTARAENWVKRLPPEEIDVGTAAFLVWSLVPDQDLEELGRVVLRNEPGA